MYFGRSAGLIKARSLNMATPGKFLYCVIEQINRGIYENLKTMKFLYLSKLIEEFPKAKDCKFLYYVTEC